MSFKSSFCYSCLLKADEIQLNEHLLKDEYLRNLFQIEKLLLCPICLEDAKVVENFIQNVKKNQLWLAKKSMETEDNQKSSKTVKEEATTEDHDKFLYVPSVLPESEKLTKFVDSTMKLQENIKFENIKDNNFDADNDIMEEDDFPLKYLRQDTHTEGNVDDDEKEDKKNKEDNFLENKEDIYKSNKGIQVITLTEQECLDEINQRLQDPKYMNKLYKCEHCVKGFDFKYSLDRHMKFHSRKKGEHQCKICKFRHMASEYITQHMKNVHFTRYKCVECGVVRRTKMAALDHVSATHTHHEYVCDLCGKFFKRKKTLNHHIFYSHSEKKRVNCTHCDKTFANKASLNIHITVKHTAGKKHYKYECKECGERFATPTYLKMHGLKHTDVKSYYCVECDKSFKTKSSLNTHVKMTRSHNKVTDLPLSCEQCDKRFAIKRDLDRHVNSMHLNIRPFKCDLCPKAYVANCSLKEHRRTAHEGYKNPLKYPCTVCERVFGTRAIMRSHIRTHTGERPYQCARCPSQFTQSGALRTHVKLSQHILKSHIRTHTGERPYQCGQCPAQFAQAGVLNTHIKLVHLKLTRDGRPKNSVSNSIVSVK